MLKMNQHEKNYWKKVRIKKNSSIFLAAYTDYRHVQRIIRG